MNETNTTALPIHITPHHLTLSPALRDFAKKKLAKVPRFASDVLAADLVLRRHHGTADGKRFSASARLALAGHDIHAIATHADLYTAIVKLVARLSRRSRKRKTRLAKVHATRRSPDSRNPQRRSGGQEQRVFGFRRTAPFAFSQM
jgi:putative sigma-54 modulation protein